MIKTKTFVIFRLNQEKNIRTKKCTKTKISEIKII